MSDVPVFTPGEILTASELQVVAGLAQSYTPLLTATTTNPTLGSGSSQVGVWSQDGSMIDVFARIDFGTSGVAAGSGSYQISLPTEAQADASLIAAGIGVARLADVSAPARRNFAVVLDTQARVVMQDEVGATVTNASPWTWAASDWMTIHLRYRLA